MDKKGKDIIIGKRIRELRTKHKETQETLAKAINVSQTHISKMETGCISLTIYNLSRIAEHYNISPNFLWSDDNSDALLEILKKYINISFKTTQLGIQSFSYPCITIDKSFFNYLFSSATATNYIIIPGKIRDTWLHDIEKDFYEANKHNTFKEKCCFALLPENFIAPDDNKVNWKQSDLIRELNNELSSLIKPSSKVPYKE